MALTNKLAAIADAIREKTGGSDLLTLDGMVTAIDGIQTGGGGGGFPNGTEWTLIDSTSKYRQYVSYANGLWHFAGSDGIYYSTDGAIWVSSNYTSSTNGVLYANGLWVSFSKRCYYSTDGKTWLAGNGLPINNEVSKIVYSNGVWVAAFSDSKGMYYSANGRTWAQSNVTSDWINSLCNASGIWVAGLGAGGIWYSLDGKTWTQSNVKSSSNVRDVCNGNGLWVAVSNEAIYNSVTWEPTE